jgi:lysophospholipase L1-like esterase
VTVDETVSTEGGSRLVAIAFVAGFLTASAMALAFFAFLGFRIGFKTIWEKTGVALTSVVFDMPGELVDELASMGGAVDNAGNPTNVRKHDTILVRPDEELEKVLRPAVSVDAYQIRAGDPVNLDPPVVYTRAGAEMSDALRAYLEKKTRVRYTYNIDEHGFRRTVPEVLAPKKILVVGDSAVFGVGVDDEDTIASGLQRLVGDSYRVVNAGVSGYNGNQIFKAARRLSERGDYEILVYVAHNNDFVHPRRNSYSENAHPVIADFESLKSRFPGGIVVALFTALEYNADDVLLSEGWSRKRIASLDLLRRDLPPMIRQAGFPFVDWTDIVAEVRKQEKTIFAPWSLYADHAHLSPRGTRLFAERIHAAFPEKPPGG